MAAGAGLDAVAGRLDPGLTRPWVDWTSSSRPLARRHRAVRLGPRYGPLNWPRRRPRGAARQGQQTPAYWKAADLDEFDGDALGAGLGCAPTRAPSRMAAPTSTRTEVRGDHPREPGRHPHRPGHRRRHTLCAHPASPAPGPARRARARGRHRPLHDGDTYIARVYVPHPSTDQLADAGTTYPGLDRAVPDHASARRRRRPPPAACDRHGASGRPARPPAAGRARAHRHRGRARGDRVAGPLGLRPHLRAGPAARARRRYRPTTSPLAINDYLTPAGYVYSEDPPEARGAAARRVPVRRARLLPAVLGRDGAASAHGRRARAGGGGFSPGSFERQARRLRDPRHRRPLLGRGRGSPDTAGSTFDPTPPSSPARSQLINLDLPDATAPAGLAGRPPTRGDRPEPGPRAAGGAGSGGLGRRGDRGAARRGGGLGRSRASWWCAACAGAATAERAGVTPTWTSCAALSGAPAARSRAARRWPRSRRASASTRARRRTCGPCGPGASGSPRTGRRSGSGETCAVLWRTVSA